MWNRVRPVTASEGDMTYLASFIISALIFISLSAVASFAVEGDNVTVSNVSSAQVEAAKLALEQRRLALEEKKIIANEAKWPFEIMQPIGTVVAIFIPLLVAALTLRSQAKANFLLKAAEVVMASRSPEVALRRAALLEAAYPKWLPPGFFTKKPEIRDFPGYIYDQKIELFRAMSASPTRQGDIARIWRKLYPDEAKFIKELDKLENLPEPPQNVQAGARTQQPNPGVSMGFLCLFVLPLMTLLLTKTTRSR
jgi:hypothetical protein